MLRITNKVTITSYEWGVQKQALAAAYKAYCQGDLNRGNGIMKSRRKALRTRNFRNLGIVLDRLNDPKRSDVT